MDIFIEEWTRALEIIKTPLDQKKYLYGLFFPGKCVYIGVTSNLRKRISEHKCKPVNKLMKEKIKSGMFTSKILMEIEYEEELYQEELAIIDFKLNGYQVLNKKQGGI